MKKMIGVMVLAAALALTAAACGGGSSGGTDTAFGNTATLRVTGVNTDPAFTSNGKFTVGFVAQDANGTSILAGQTASSDVSMTLSITDEGGWTKTLTKATDAGVTCTITVPDATTGTPIDLTSTQPSSAGKVMGAPLIDDSGSMDSSDPAPNKRGPAANTFINSVCGCTNGASCTQATRMFGALDFGINTPTAGFTYTRDLMTANGVTNAQLTGTGSALPYAVCNDNNVALGQAAITAKIVAEDSTPMYESILEVCQKLATLKASGGQLNGYGLALLVLSDGAPNGGVVDAATALGCLTANAITTCTVGLGSGSELDPYPDTTAVQALKDVAAAGGCVYAAATSASALQPIFDAIGVAVSSGFNSAIFQLDPIPAPGTTVTGTLTVGGQTATFTFIAP